MDKNYTLEELQLLKDERARILEILSLQLQRLARYTVAVQKAGDLTIAKAVRVSGLMIRVAVQMTTISTQPIQKFPPGGILDRHVGGGAFFPEDQVNRAIVGATISIPEAPEGREFIIGYHGRRAGKMASIPPGTHVLPFINESAPVNLRDFNKLGSSQDFPAEVPTELDAKTWEIVESKLRRRFNGQPLGGFENMIQAVIRYICDMEIPTVAEMEILRDRMAKTIDRAFEISFFVGDMELQTLDAAAALVDQVIAWEKTPTAGSLESCLREAGFRVKYREGGK
jgi:hypothetical protein